MKDGGPAFPRSSQGGCGDLDRASGMTLRDWFAGMAMSAIAKDGIVTASIPSLANATGRDKEWRADIIEAVTRSAYDIADAMLLERDKKS